jgi:hypothetical protein
MIMNQVKEMKSEALPTRLKGSTLLRRAAVACLRWLYVALAARERSGKVASMSSTPRSGAVGLQLLGDVGGGSTAADR